MWIKNAWYVAGWSSELGNEPLARTLLSEPVVLYRSEHGDPVALEDRCCHRFAPLSKGRVEGDCIRCMYHGLKFDSTGACVEIPGAENANGGLHVRSFPLVEKEQFLWIWLGDPSLADPATIIDNPYLVDPDWPYKEGYLHYDANYLLIIDNFLDFSHLAFVHESTIGSTAATEMPAKLKDTEFGINIEKYWLGDDPAPHFVKFAGLDGKVDRWNIYDLHLRGNILLMDASNSPAGDVNYDEGVSQDLREVSSGFRHTSILTPETETTTHYFFCHARNFAVDVPNMSEQVLETVVTAFREDKAIIEAQQLVISKTDPNRRMQAIHHDKALFKFRRKIADALEEEAQTALAAE